MLIKWSVNLYLVICLKICLCLALSKSKLVVAKNTVTVKMLINPFTNNFLKEFTDARKQGDRSVRSMILHRLTRLNQHNYVSNTPLTWKILQPKARINQARKNSGKFLVEK